MSNVQILTFTYVEKNRVSVLKKIQARIACKKCLVYSKKKGGKWNFECKMLNGGEI